MSNEPRDDDESESDLDDPPEAEAGKVYVSFHHDSSGVIVYAEGSCKDEMSENSRDLCDWSLEVPDDPPNGIYCWEGDRILRNGGDDVEWDGDWRNVTPEELAGLVGPKLPA